MIDPGLEGKVVLVTGANHGIGEATAKAFAAQGASVCITYYRSACPYSEEELDDARLRRIGGPLLHYANQQQPVEPLLKHIRTSGGKAEAIALDLSDFLNISALFDWCESCYGPVDILVNNHTIDRLDTFDPERVTNEGFGIHLTTAENVDAHFQTNTRAYTLLMAEYFKRIIARETGWGRVINMSTDAAHAHAANISYAASKHAIESYSRSAAVEMGKYGITVNIVAPGPIQTGYIRPEDEAYIAPGTPLGRLGIPADVADVIVYLASKQASWLTGQLLYVGGGWRIGQ